MSLSIRRISTELTYDGYFKVYRHRLQHELFEGGWSAVIDRECFDRGRVACVLAYDPAMDSLLLVEQFRIGAIGDESSQWLLELVAGVVETGEAPAEVVRREALEEAGCTLGEVEQIAQFYVSPGCMSEHATVFYSECSLEGVGGVHGLVEEGENIAVRVASRESAMRMLENGEIQNSKAIIALQWFALQYPQRYGSR